MGRQALCFDRASMRSRCGLVLRRDGAAACNIMTRGKEALAGAEVMAVGRQCLGSPEKSPA
jgi:hypothetical protein